MSALDRAAAALPAAYPGPGGAIAVLKNGEPILRHAWGYANAERRIPFTPATLFRLCSITKQFTCAVLLGHDPATLAPHIEASLPNLTVPPPTPLHLAHNQSGLRDYWAVAMLLGAPAESAFSDREAALTIASARTLQFAPGTSYSYSNGNFRLLADALAAETGRSFPELLQAHVFDPAGMQTALLAADTAAMPDGTEGYEGSVDAGFRPAVNRILWTGDAGIGASLDDLIAWERHIDRTRDDPAALYRRLSAPVTFADGTDASYGFGLGRHTAFGRAITSHGGALRGWRSHRLHVAAERLSVVVLFNHMAEAHEAANRLLAAALGAEPDPAPPLAPLPPWSGPYLDSETALAARLDHDRDGHLRLRYDRHPERLALRPDGSAHAAFVSLTPSPDGLSMHRPAENHRSRLLPLAGPPNPDIAGRYGSDELGAELLVTDAGGTLYGTFSGPLGGGRMEPLQHVAADVWLLPMPRALDHTPPGDWTLAFHRDRGRITAATIGCWLARKLRYTRLAR